MTTTTTLVSPVSAPAATWQIDPSHTQVEFAVRHLMISTVRGRFSDVTGSVTVPDGDFSRAALQASIGVASLDTREPQRDAHLRSADFFDAEVFPTITFKSRRVDANAGDPGRFVLVGDLTLHGVTREVRLDVTVEGRGRDPWGNERAGFSVTARVSRKDFGLVWNQLLETGGVAVGDEVKIAIDTEIVAVPAQAAA
jgi:polyisoprenoid-binding protein YceI